MFEADVRSGCISLRQDGVNFGVFGNQSKGFKVGALRRLKKLYFDKIGKYLIICRAVDFQMSESRGIIKKTGLVANAVYGIWGVEWRGHTCPLWLRTIYLLNRPITVQLLHDDTNLLCEISVTWVVLCRGAEVDQLLGTGHHRQIFSSAIINRSPVHLENNIAGPSFAWWRHEALHISPITPT